MLVPDFRTSISDLQLFRDEPALWIIKHMLGYRTESGAAATRGHAVEYAMQARVRFPKLSQDNALKLAEKTFMLKRGKKLVEDLDESELKEFTALKGFVDQVYDACDKLGLGRYKHVQQYVQEEIEGIKLRGYTDFDWDKSPKGIKPARILDLKTTHRVPSEMRDTHIEQQTFYSDCLNMESCCLYLSSKKWTLIQLEEKDKPYARAKLRLMARSAKAAMDSPDWDTLKALYIPRDLDGFRWDAKAKFLAQGVWGL